MQPYWDAFAFPFKRGNRGVLVLGLFVLSILPAVLAFVPLGGWVALLFDFAFLGYYGLFLQAILHAAMQGDDRIPAWPDFDSPMELVGDFLTLVVPFLVSFFPLILLRGSLAGLEALIDTGFVLRSAVPQGDSLPVTLLQIPLLVAGWLYLPMATLAWTFFGSASILNPVSVARAAWSTGPAYLAVAGLTWILVTAAWAVSLIPGKYLTTFGSSLLVFYALVVAVRLIGTHYRLNRERLGWERVPQALPRSLGL